MVDLPPLSVYQRVTNRPISMSTINHPTLFSEFKNKMACNQLKRHITRPQNSPFWKGVPGMCLAAHLEAQRFGLPQLGLRPRKTKTSPSEERRDRLQGMDRHHPKHRKIVNPLGLLITSLAPWSINSFVCGMFILTSGYYVILHIQRLGMYMNAHIHSYLY